MIENTPEARREAQRERHRPGFEDIVWFRMDIGRRQNADPRWILPLLCRRGHITKNEVGAIRIGANETHFQVPRAIAKKFNAALARTGASEGDEPSVRIEPSETTAHEPGRENREASKPKRADAALPHQARPNGRGSKKRTGRGARQYGSRPGERGQ